MSQNIVKFPENNNIESIVRMLRSKAAMGQKVCFEANGTRIILQGKYHDDEWETYAEKIRELIKRPAPQETQPIFHADEARTLIKELQESAANDH